MDNLQGQEHLMTIPTETITILLRMVSTVLDVFTGKLSLSYFHLHLSRFLRSLFFPPLHIHSSILSPPPTLSVFLSASSPSRRSSNPGIMNSQLSLAIPALPANTTLDEFAQLLA